MRWLIILSALLFVSCNLEEEKYIKEVQEFRAFKNQQMLKSDSPLDSSQRKVFTGLKYFEIDPSWRFEIPLKKATYPSYVQLSKDTSISMVYEELGSFQFVVRDQSYELQAFLGKGEGKGRLFVPFGDQTNGKETYGGGRYLYATLQEGGNYLLDFNYAHNPFCAYNHEYSCALPPKQNILDLKIFVGEKMLFIDSETEKHKE